MVEEFSEQDYKDLEYAKKVYKLNLKCFGINYKNIISKCLSTITVEPYLYKDTNNGVWILSSVNLRSPQRVWAKLEHSLNKIYELWD